MGKLTIKISTFWLAILLALLLLPDDFFSIGSIYYSGTPSFISYKFLDYRFNFMQLIIIAVGFCIAIVKKNKVALYIGLYFTLREVLCFLFQDNSLFKVSAYEMYLNLFVGVSLILWSFYNTKSEGEASYLYETFLILNIFTVYIMAFRGGAGGRLAERCNAINLDVGTTGCLCCIGLIFIYYHRTIKFKVFMIAAISIALYLSGSRINMVLAVLFTVTIVMTTWWKKVKGEKSKISRNAFFIASVIIVIIAIVLFIKRNEIITLITESRYATLLRLSSIQSDSSMIGRGASIKAGLDVLKNYPMGISGYFINLQTEIRMRGFATFPHCGLLSAYLIYGPITLALYIFCIWLVFKMYRTEKKYAWTLTYLLVYNLIAGGPIVNFKIIYIFGMPIVLAWQRLKEVGKNRSNL